jgi:ParB/RepB/Spo0J family partition protein
MSAKHAKNAAMIALDHLRIPDAYASPSRKVDDEILRNSIQLTGVQQPLIVARISSEQYLVMDGVRRWRVAKSLGLDSLPCVIDHGINDVDDAEQYRNRIRFVLDEHRQDLLPTQRATLIRKLQESFQLTAKEVALYLGVTPGTITNWMLVEKAVPEIQRAVDAGEITIHTVRAFAGMTPAGQRKVWEGDNAALRSMSASSLHRWIRQTYSPSEHADFYESPEKLIKQLQRKSAPRKAKKRAVLTVDEKQSLLKDVDAKRIELDDKRSQIREIESHINAAIPAIRSIRANRELWQTLPPATRKDFEEFAVRLV